MRVRIYIYIWAGVQECLRIVIRAVHGHDYRHKQTFTGGKKKLFSFPMSVSFSHMIVTSTSFVYKIYLYLHFPI